MKRYFLLFAGLIAIVALLLGCTDQKRLENIEKTQQEILNKLKSIEQKQDQMARFFQSRRPTIDWNKVYKIPIGSSYIRGKKDAKVTIVEFSDFQCPYCARLQPTLKKVLKTFPNDVKLVYKDFPLSFHKYAKMAARAARAAGEQDKFWEMHDLIFESFSTLSEEKFKEFAKKLNLDMDKFLKDFKSDKYDKLIQADINLGRSVGVTGTPTLFINGKRVRNRSFEALKTTIEEYLKKG